MEILDPNKKIYLQLTESNHSISIGVKKLESSLVECVRYAQQSLKGMKFGERDEAEDKYFQLIP
jgi:hypothetical protein